MFAVEFRLGTESHDVYTYYGWQTLTIDDPDLVTFTDAEEAAHAFILELLKDEWSGTWQIRVIERVAYGDANAWPTEYIL